jgi:molybdenum cofactor cytidylyltransferase
LIFAELPLAEAEGAILAHALRLGGQHRPKGTPVDAAVLAAAAAAGLERLWVARAEPGDVPEADAACRIAEALAGEGLAVRPPAHGRVNLHASAGGLLEVAADALSCVNAVSEAVAVATLAPFTPVSAGELVATVKIIPYAMGGAELAAALAAVPPGGGLMLRRWRPGLRAVLLQSRLPEAADKQLAKTAEVTRARLARLGIAMAQAPAAAHDVGAIAAALAAAEADLLLVAGATATSDRRDVIPAALDAAGGTVERVGMPVDPGNLLVLGRLGRATVIGLPGCARSPKRNGLDLVLERFAAGLAVRRDEIARMGVGGLLEESGRPVPWGWAR